MKFLETFFYKLVTAIIYTILFVIIFYAWTIFAPLILSVGLFLFLYGLIRKLDHCIIFGIIIGISGGIGMLLNHWLNIF